MMALDIPTLSKQLYSSTLRPSNYLFEHVVGLETPPAGFPTYTYDPEGAQAMLEEAGWDTNTELEWLSLVPGDRGEDAMAGDAGRVGIKTKYRQIDAATVIDELYPKATTISSSATSARTSRWTTTGSTSRRGWAYDNGGFNYRPLLQRQMSTRLAGRRWTKPILPRRSSLWNDVALMLLQRTSPQGTVWRQSITYVWNNRVRGAYPYQYRLPVRPASRRSGSLES